MSTTQDIFDFLTPYQLLDENLSQSYENTKAEQRALIKQAISFHFSMQRFISPYTGELEQHFSHNSSGLFCSIHKKKAPFLFCMLDNNSYENKKNALSPALLLSILCPAIMAEIENIIFFFYEKPNDLLLTTLELCGIENIYIYQNDKAHISSYDKTSSLTKILEKQENPLNSFNNKKNQINNYEQFYNIAEICLKKLQIQNFECRKFEFEGIKKNLTDLSNFKDKLNTINKDKGRFILFQDKQELSSLVSKIHDTAKSLDIISYHENTKPVILANKSQAAALLLAYPQAIIDFEQNTQEEDETIQNEDYFYPFPIYKETASKILNMPYYSAQIKEQEQLKTNSIANSQQRQNYDISFIIHKKGNQNYTKNMELCYVHPIITIDFFINKSIVARV